MGFTDFQRETRGIRRRLYYNPQRGGVAEKGATRVEKHEGGLVMSQIRLTTMADRDCHAISALPIAQGRPLLRLRCERSVGRLP